MNFAEELRQWPAAAADDHSNKLMRIKLVDMRGAVIQVLLDSCRDEG